MTMFGRLQILAQFANIHYLHFALSQFAQIVTIINLMACTTGHQDKITFFLRIRTILANTAFSSYKLVDVSI